MVKIDPLESMGKKNISSQWDKSQNLKEHLRNF